MKDLEKLRESLTKKVHQIGDEPINIPRHLKEPFVGRWERCIKNNNGHFIVSFAEGKGSKDILDGDFLKCIYAKDLVAELLEYRERLQVFLDQADVSGDEAKKLNKGAFPNNIPSWCERVEGMILSSDLDQSEKTLLIRFAKDNSWTGCTKGVGRRNDFYHSSVVNALRSNVTHNGYFGDVAKELLPMKDITQPIISWFESDSHDVEIATNLPLILPDCRFGVKLVAALLTKPFVILTGASGTGKTKLATSLAKHFSNADGSNSELVAVGADWTDNRSVLGFVNHLRAGEDKLPTYESTPILDLLLRAKDDPEVPYFLILDEMNLSHVERYFADFLSAMEQKDGFFKLHSESSDLRRGGAEHADVPAKLDYLANLFVIGTVNIDETTYMFSPKVLDRANVIEFTVTHDEIGEFLDDPKPYQEAEIAAPGVAEGFRALAEQAREMQIQPLPSDDSGGLVANHLLELFDILKSGRFEFAYRTAKEINIYLSVCRHLAEDTDGWDKSGWRHDLDAQILQKLLPKLHGSVGRIGGLLATLANYCFSGKVATNQSMRLEDALKLDEKDARFPESLVKLKAMIDTLKDEQFVSFIQ